ncbi:hypothetical protein AOZ06_28180 [Kibdelosporangium phytohabitans]|uniref:HTH tetR-type domain-containing protein n=1 Tax=Kibdelosporangium phytohabitans TaxID=860235 RepID=A0A0N9I6Z4_9PSEU|nr:hypothetical protein AOZ06_28180 [Kibdelosporangium phytohabitans]
MRTVAAESGVSPAQVQYYFRTKTELVRAAFEHSGEQFLADLRAVEGERSIDWLHHLVDVWLPLDERREQRARVWLAYAATAAIDSDLATHSAEVDAELTGVLAAELSELGCLAPQRSAAQLLALIDGVTLRMLTLPMTDRASCVAEVLTPFLRSLIP